MGTRTTTHGLRAMLVIPLLILAGAVCDRMEEQRLSPYDQMRATWTELSRQRGAERFINERGQVRLIPSAQSRFQTQLTTTSNDLAVKEQELRRVRLTRQLVVGLAWASILPVLLIACRANGIRLRSARPILEDTFGDLHEGFVKRKESLGLLGAHRWWWVELLRSIPPLVGCMLRQRGARGENKLS